MASHCDTIKGTLSLLNENQNDAGEDCQGAIDWLDHLVSLLKQVCQSENDAFDFGQLRQVRVSSELWLEITQAVEDASEGE